MIFLLVLFISFAVLGYWVFGDQYTPELFIVKRQLYDSDHILEKIQMAILGVFFLAATFGLAIFSSSMRDFLGEFINIKQSRVNYILASTMPFLGICIISSFFPKITQIFDFFTFTVYNFNGYILPFLMAIVTYVRYVKKGPQIYGYILGFGLMLGASLYCIVWSFIGPKK